MSNARKLKGKNFRISLDLPSEILERRKKKMKQFKQTKKDNKTAFLVEPSRINCSLTVLRCKNIRKIVRPHIFSNYSKLYFYYVIFDEDLDGSGGIKKTKESVKILEDICLEQDLIDIWRVRNPTEKRFTWRQKTPIIQRRLDYWLVNDSLQDDIVSVDIIPSIKSDHSAITLSINGIDDSKPGPSFWKFNCSLVNDNNYCDLLDTNIKSWLEEFKDVVDKRVLWDLLKYKIRQLTLIFTKRIIVIHHHFQKT